MTATNETYLGDGLYASFDGFQFKLRAPREEGDHVVYLDPVTYWAFKVFAEKRLPSSPSNTPEAA